jgi:hypothetical protein
MCGFMNVTTHVYISQQFHTIEYKFHFSIKNSYPYPPYFAPTKKPNSYTHDSSVMNVSIFHVQTKKKEHNHEHALARKYTSYTYTVPVEP